MHALLVLLLCCVVTCEIAAAEWRQLNGPNGAEFQALAGDAELMFGYANGRIQRFENGVWQPAAGNAEAESFWYRNSHLREWRGVLFSRSEGALEPSRLMVSTTKGESWQEANLPDMTSGIARAYLMPSLCFTEDAAFIGVGSDVYTSEDGVNWELLVSLESWRGNIERISKGVNSIFVYQHHRLILRQFNYRGFELAELRLPEFGAPFDHVLSTDSYIYVFNIEDGLYRSGDSGETWEEANANLRKDSRGRSPSFDRAVIYADGILLASDKRLWHYQFSANNWSFNSTPMEFNNLIWADGDVIADSPHGVFVSSDFGRSWEPRNAGLYLKDATIFALPNAIFAITPEILYRSLDGGASWEIVKYGLSTDYFISDNSIFARWGRRSTVMFRPDGFARSSNLGDTWSFIDANFDFVETELNEGENPLFFMTSVNKRPGGGIYASFSASEYSYDADGVRSEQREWMFGGVQVSEDEGENWTDLSANLPSRGGIAVPVAQMMQTFLGVLIITSTEEQQEQMFLLENGTDSWRAVFEWEDVNQYSTQLYGDLGMQVAVHEPSNQVAHSRDGGRSWSVDNDVFRTAETGMVGRINKIDVVRGGAYMQATVFVDNISSQRIFELEYLGSEWRWIDKTSEFPADFAPVDFFQHDDRLYAFKESAGIWSSDIIATSVSENPAIQLPLNVYPNPGEDHVNIELPVATVGAVALDIAVFDVHGRGVLHQSITPPTGLTLRLNLPQTLHPGLYFVKMSGSGLQYNTSFVTR